MTLSRCVTNMCCLNLFFQAFVVEQSPWAGERHWSLLTNGSPEKQAICSGFVHR